MREIWTTKEGDKIKYSDLEDRHLLNIISLVRKRAKERDGMMIDGGGYDPADFWCEIGTEEDWLEKFNYKGLMEELNKREISK